MKNQRLAYLAFLTRILLYVMLSAKASPFSTVATTDRLSFVSTCSRSRLEAKANGSTELAKWPSENEFSRTLKPDRILKTKRGSYHVTVTAESAEREALAERFDLSDIAKLTADLTLRPELIGGRGGSASGVEVEGTCWSTVTQRCVRTNEDFQIDLEFPIYSIVRPVMSSFVRNDNYDNDDDDGYRRKTEPRGGTKSTYRTQDRNLDEMDVMELQRMLQYDMSDDDVMEDEAIFPLDGMLDIGELVAQLFWLKLDPYPKKPGTDPVQRSITG